MWFAASPPPDSLSEKIYFHSEGFMDTNAVTVILAAFFAVVAIAVILAFRGRIAINFKKGTISGSNPPSRPPKSTFEDIRAGKNVTVQDSSTGDIKVAKVTAKGDVDITKAPSGQPPGS